MSMTNDRADHDRLVRHLQNIVDHVDMAFEAVSRPRVSHCLSTGAEGDDTLTMACPAFEFLPPPGGLEVQFQVVRAAPADAGEADDTSIRAVMKIADMENLDCRIRLCNGLRAHMANRTKELLEEAGYIATALGELEA